MASGKRYVTLDGLRGVAAVMVLFHHTEAYRDGFSFAPHGYLAVDFFLMLSGFVIARGYQPALAGVLGLKEFFRRRVVRLYPVAFAGLLLGCLKLGLEALNGQGTLGPSDAILIACTLNLFLLPYWSANYLWGDVFPANTVMWSLFAEILIYLGWAALVRKGATINMICVIMAVCGSISLWSISTDGVNPLRYGYVMGPSARVIFDFLLGVIAFNFDTRFKLTTIMPSRLRGSGVLGVLLAVILGMPWLGTAWDMLAIYLLLPLILFCGIASGVENGSGPRKFLGDISYPLYAVHYPIFLLLSGFRHTFLPQVGALPAILSGIGLSIATAILICYFYDIPTRRYIAVKARPAAQLSPT